MRELMHGRTIDLPTPVIGIEQSIVLLPREIIRARMAELRRRTAPAHERLDALISSSGWLRTLDGYRHLLGRFYGIYLPLDAALADAIHRYDLPLDWSERRKAHLLVQDLRALGVSAADLADLPEAPTVPPVSSRAAALGCLYVVEGATLGGQVISRHLRRHLGIEADTGASFFASYGDDVGRRWHALCSLLADVLQEPDAEHTIVESAVSTFGGFGLWLDGGAREGVNEGVGQGDTSA